MEKLKPIIEQKFWIFFALTLIFPLVGWWGATNAKNAEIEKRTTEITASFGTAEKDYSKVANKIWFDELSLVKNEEDKRYDAARYYLWDQQRKLQTWPDQYIKVRMKGIYEITPENSTTIDSHVAKYYKNIYHREVMKLYNQLKPYSILEIPSKKTKTVKLKENGIIAVKGKERVFPIYNHEAWSKHPPSIETVWETQEDLWLLKSIVDAINEMNAGADNISESTIKVLVDIDFMGGKGKGYKQAKPKKKGVYNKRTGKKIKKSKAAEEQEKMKLLERRDKISMNPGRQLDLIYNPAEDFGEEAGLEVSSRTGRIRTGGGFNKKEARTGSKGTARRSQGLGAHTKQFRTKAQKNFRYVDNDEKDPYKTRGFQIHLVMDHRKIPQFIEELSKSPWAIRIYRTHIANSRGSNQFEGLVPLSELKVDTTKKKKKKRKQSLSVGNGGFGRGEESSENTRTPPRTVGEKKTGYQHSLTDPYLAEVIISGKFTIYRMPSKIPEEVLNKENEVAEAELPDSTSKEEKTQTPENKDSQDIKEKTQDKPEEKANESENSVTQLNNN